MIEPRKPSVSFVLNYADPALGMERVALNLSEMLADTHDVSLVVGAGAIPSVKGVEATSLGSAARFGSVVRAWRLFRASARVSADVVIVVGVWAAVPYLLNPRSSRRASIVVWEHSLSREKVASARVLRILKPLARVLYRRARVVVCVSDPLTADLNALLPRTRVVTIPNVVRSGSSRAPSLVESGADEVRLVTVGSLTETKRQRFIVEALARVRENVSLDIVGSGPTASELQTLVASLGLEDRVRFRGYLPHVDTLAAIRGATALVHSAMGETFGVVYVEAADAGVPVIAFGDRVTRSMIPTFVPGVTYSSTDELVGHLESPPRPTESVFAEAAARRRSAFGGPVVLQSWTSLLDGLAPTGNGRQ